MAPNHELEDTLTGLASSLAISQAVKFLAPQDASAKMAILTTATHLPTPPTCLSPTRNSSAPQCHLPAHFTHKHKVCAPPPAKTSCLWLSLQEKMHWPTQMKQTSRGSSVLNAYWDLNWKCYVIREKLSIQIRLSISSYDKDTRMYAFPVGPVSCSHPPSCNTDSELRVGIGQWRSCVRSLRAFAKHWARCLVKAWGQQPLTALKKDRAQSQARRCYLPRTPRLGVLSTCFHKWLYLLYHRIYDIWFLRFIRGSVFPLTVQSQWG